MIAVIIVIIVENAEEQKNRTLEFCAAAASRGRYQPTERVIPLLRLHCWAAAQQTFLKVSGNLSHVPMVMT